MRATTKAKQYVDNQGKVHFHFRMTHTEMMEEQQTQLTPSHITKKNKKKNIYKSIEVEIETTKGKGNRYKKRKRKMARN